MPTAVHEGATPHTSYIVCSDCNTLYEDFAGRVQMHMGTAGHQQLLIKTPPACLQLQVSDTLSLDWLQPVCSMSASHEDTCRQYYEAGMSPCKVVRF